MGAGWRASLAALLKQHNAVKGGGRTASAATRIKRADVLFAGFQELRELGYRLDDVRSFRSKHLSALGAAWEAKGLSPSTLQGRISVFRVFAGWIGKQGMIEGSERYVQSASSVARSTINREDKSWAAKDVDVAAKIEEVRSVDPRIALMLELQLAFGLRVQEAMMLRPHLADRVHALDVSRGAKNGRPRYVEVDTDEKRAVLDRAKALVRDPTESMADPRLSLERARSAYYRVVRKAGITRKEGITSHGLRHQAANDLYERHAGAVSPVRGGVQPADPQQERYARLETAEFLGHSRADICTYYVGSYASAPKSGD